MATSLVQRTRQVVAAEDDDFFLADTILYYLNKSLRKVVAYMVQQELRPTIQTQDGVVKGQDRSLRALDTLRSVENITLSAFSDESSYFYGTESFPTNVMQLLYLRYNGKTILRELNSKKLYMLQWGNLVPTVYEGYFYVTDSTGKSFDLYLHEDPVGNDLNVFYIKNPTELDPDTDIEATEFVDLPEQLENAVIYGAALMMISQESVKDPQGNIQVINEIYQQELQSNTY